MNYLPSKLLKLRKHYNYSQSHVAEVLGIDVVEYMAYENGRKVLNYNQCKKIANLYHVGTIDIFKNSDEVTLYEVSKAKTDELNIEYFLPKKTLKDKIEILFKKHSLLIGATSVILIVGIVFSFIFLKKEDNIEVPYEPVLSDVNRLSTSNTTVVYISKEGAVKGSGDNSNGQLSNLPSSNAIKVAEGSSFTIILNNDGTLSSIGFLNDYASELSEWKNIVDVDAGENHVVGVDNTGKVYAIGDNTYGQCEVEEFENIGKVYASKNGTIVIDKEGRTNFTGEFIGSSQIKNYKNLLDIDTSNDNLVLLTSDNRVDYITKSKNFLSIYKWRDVINVACGDEYVAALLKDGSVVIDCEDQAMINEVSKWSNIIAIDSSDDYLIAFDGEKIYGVGKNNYHQFEQELIEKMTLAQVSGVKVSVSNTIDVMFDKVDNADGYEIKLEIDNPVIYKVSSNQAVSFATDFLQDGITYKLVITTLGDGIKYNNSMPLEVPFAYYKESSEKNEYIDIDVDFENMTVDEFKNYMREIGVQETNLISVETSEICDGMEKKIISVDGISKGQRISKSDLNNAHITYNYCRIKETLIEEASDEQDLEN